MAGATRARTTTMRRWFPAWALSLASRGLRRRRWRRRLSRATLPATLVVSAPTTQQALGATVAFSANAAEPGSQLPLGLRRRQHQHRGRARRHAYTRAGVFTVRLTLGNGAGSVSGSTQRRGRRLRDRRRQDLQPRRQQRLVLAAAAAAGQLHPRLRLRRRQPRLGRRPGRHACSPPSTAASPGARSIPGTTLDLSQAVFPSATAGWLTSEFGELLRTADGGASWRRVSYGRNDFVLALGASDADTAWVTTTLGAGFVTRDGGSSWRQVDPAPGGTLPVRVRQRHRRLVAAALHRRPADPRPFARRRRDLDDGAAAGDRGGLFRLFGRHAVRRCRCMRW